MILKSLAGMALVGVVPGLCAPIYASAAESPPSPASTALPAVVVTATQSPVQTLIDRKVYSVATDLLSTSGTAADVLNQVPSIEVDADGNVSLRGDSNVTILVDGKPSAVLSGPLAGVGLQQFPASDIEKIEVMTNPPAQYKAEASGGVINIITKKSHKSGSSGTVQASLGNERRYVLGGTGNYNSGPMSISGGFGLRQDTRERLVNSALSSESMTNELIKSRESLDEHLRRVIPSIKGGIDYRLNEHQSLGFSFSRRERRSHRMFDQHDESDFASGSPISVSDRHSDGHEWSLDSEQTLHFSQILRRPEETLDLSLSRTIARERERYAYRNSHTLPVGIPTYDHLNLSQDLVTTEMSADYAFQFSEVRSVKMGYDFQEDSNAFDNSGDTIDSVTGVPVVNPAITNDFRYRQKVHAAYASYQSSTESRGLLAGARVEHTAIETRQITDSITSTSHYAHVYPNVHLDRHLSEKSTLSLSFSRRVSRPDAGSLNPFADHQDTHNLRAGNPNLVPQDTRSFELGYSVESSKLHYGLTGYLRRNRNSVTEVTQLVSADVVLTTKANLPKSTSEGFEFTANGRVTRTVSYALSGNLFRTEIDASAIGVPGLKSTTGLNAKASVDYHPTLLDTAQISFSRSDKRLTPQGYVSAINLVNLGYKRQLRANLSAVVTVSDLFNGQKFQRFVNTPALMDTYQRAQAGRLAYVGIVYSLGVTKKSKATNFEYDQ